MALDIDAAKIALDRIGKCVGESRCSGEYELLYRFINDVEKLMKHNSIRQIPALCRPWDEGD